MMIKTGALIGLAAVWVPVFLSAAPTMQSDQPAAYSIQPGRDQITPVVTSFLLSEDTTLGPLNTCCTVVNTEEGTVPERVNPDDPAPPPGFAFTPIDSVLEDRHILDAEDVEPLSPAASRSWSVRYGAGTIQDVYPPVSIVPSPSALLLAGIGTFLVGWIRRRGEPF